MYHSGPPMDAPPEYPYPGKRGRYDEGPDMAYQELERRNMELQKENDSLKRELARERERYEDLYALFRQHQHQVCCVSVDRGAPTGKSIADALAVGGESGGGECGSTGGKCGGVDASAISAGADCW